MTPRYRILALDLDGTLLGRDKSVSRRNGEAVQAALEAGVRIVLATGRRYPAARPVAEQLGEDIPLVLHNGGLIVEGREVVRCTPLPRDVAVRAIRLGREAGAEPVVHCGHEGEGKLLVERMPPTEPVLAMYLRRAHADVGAALNRLRRAERRSDIGSPESRLHRDPITCAWEFASSRRRLSDPYSHRPGSCFIVAHAIPQLLW